MPFLKLQLFNSKWYLIVKLMFLKSSFLNIKTMIFILWRNSEILHLTKLSNSLKKNFFLNHSTLFQRQLALHQYKF